MKRTNSSFYTRRTLALTLLSFVAVAALVSFGVSARRAKRAAGLQASNSKAVNLAKPLINVQDKNPNAPEAGTMSATLNDGVAPGTKVPSGGTINYTAVLNNTAAPAAGGVNDALSVAYNATLDANTTISGVVQVSPVTRNDTYPNTVIGNVAINSDNTPFSVLTNDYMGQNPAGTITAFSATSAQNGNVVVDADGTFTYNPPAGYEGPDSFTYTLSNAAGSSIGTVNLTVGGMVWFINNNGGACPSSCDGRITNPFTTLAAFQAVNNGTGNNPAANDNVFLYESATSYTGPVTLLTSQKLIGQDATATLAAITGLTPPAGSNAFPTMNTGAPATTINNSTVGSNAVNLCAVTCGASTNVVRGLTVTTGSTTSKGISGTSFGTLSASDLIISGSGPAVDLSTGTLAVTIDSLSSNGSGAEGVRLDNLAGTFTANAGSLQNATNEDVDISGNNASDTLAFTYAGSITDDLGTLISVVNQNGGTKLFSGAITDGNDGDGSGIVLTNNTGATMNFTGGITLSTGSNPAFTATNGGTVNIPQDVPNNKINTITTTTGTALNVANTTIGASELTFRSINVSGNNTLPANGIILTNTGTNGFNIVGNGGSCTAATPTCTGGTIQGTGSHGIWFTSVSNIEFTRIRINNTGDHGIFGDGVNNLSLIDSYIHDFGNTAGAAVSEDGMHFESTNLANTAPGHGLTGTVIIQRAQFGPDSAFTRTPNPPLPENKGIVVRNHNDVNLNMTVTGSKFIQISNDGIDADIRNETDAAGGVGTATLNVDGSTADGTNTFDNINGRSINFVQPVDNAAARIYELTIKNNTFTSVGIGGRWMASARGTMNARYNNNTMTSTSDDCIRSESDAVNAALSPKASVNATVTNNNMGGGSVFISLHRQALTNMAFNNNTNIGGTAAGAGGCATCLGVHTGINLRSDRGSALGIDIQGNTGTADGSLAFAQSALDLQATNNGGGNSTICANIGGAGALKNTLTQNPDTAGQQVISIDPVGGSTITIEGGPGGSPGTENFLIANNTLNGTNKVAISTPGAVPSGVGANCVTSTPSALFDNQTAMNSGRGTNAPTAPADAGSSVAVLAKGSNTAALPAIVSPQLMASAKVAVSDVSAKDAAVRDQETSEARRSHHAQFKRANATKATAITNAGGDNPIAPEADVIGPITIGTLEPGKSVTIKYSATVNLAPTARQASHQGSFSFTNGGTTPLVTDDTDSPGVPLTDPTVTLFDVLMTWNGSVDTDWNNAANWTAPAGGTAYAPGVSNPAVNDIVIPAAGVTNEPTIGAAIPDITIFSLNHAAGRTLTIDPARKLTIGAPAAGVGGDLTLNGIITGGELRFGTGSHNFNVGAGGSLSSTNVATVLSSSTVTLNNNLQAGALAVNSGGSMNITGRTLKLNGSGAALTVPAGATFTTATSTVEFNGTAAQTVQQAAALITFNNLTINNTAAGAPNALGVTLTGAATVNGVLALTSNDLDTGAFTLTQPNTTLSTGVSDVIGTVARTGAPLAASTLLTFGNPNNQITFANVGTRPTSVTVTLAKVGGYPASVSRNYNITQTGGANYSATLRLRYLDSELNGNSETPDVNFNFRRQNTVTNAWQAVIPTFRDTAGVTEGWLENNAVTAFSKWTFDDLAPTAADSSVTGRIVDNHGAPVEGAVVRLTGDANRKFITDANGFYRFDNVETGGFYNVTPSRVNYRFEPAVISFSQLGETTEAAFDATATGSNVNPLDTPEYFVRQNYLDFLGREPDEAGFNFWSDQILACGVDTDCVDRKRTHVSAAYFFSIEFQETGGLVDGLYRSAYGARPNFAEFKADAGAVAPGLVVGRDAWQTDLEKGKAAFIQAFVQRPAFQSVYGGLSDEAFVNALVANTGVSFTSAERSAFVSGLGNGVTRAATLRAIVENPAFVSAKRNNAFVMMEYFGYLRREPDAGGFDYWLNKLIQFNGNFEQAEMVRAFIISGEYRDRFPR